MNRVEIFEKDMESLIKDLNIIKQENEIRGRRHTLYFELDNNLCVEINYTEIITNIIQVDSDCYDREGNTKVEYSFLSDNNKAHKKRLEQFLKEVLSIII